MNPAVFYLTVGNEEEADAISALLLKKKLVVCIKKQAVQSTYRFKNKIESATEVLLVMESTEDLFTQAEKEIRTLHSYETFVFFSTAITKMTSDMELWFKQELHR